MNIHNTRRRDDRSASAADHFKPWIPTVDKDSLDHESERRRNRSATLPASSYDPRSYPPLDTRYIDPRQPSRSHRQDPRYPSAAPYSSHHHSSVQAPPTSKAYQHATRPSAQYSSSGYHYPQPSSHQLSHTTPAYPAAGSSRRPYPDPPDPRPSGRSAPPNHQTTYDQVSSGEEMAKASRHPSRLVHPSTQPPLSAPTNQAFWNPAQETSSSRRHKDPYKDRDRDQERGREKEREKEKDRGRDNKPTTELENRYKDKARAERHRERERDRAAEVRHPESSKSKHHDRRKDSDTEGVLYPEQRNTSKASLSGREGYSTTVRESSNGHRRHRTEDGTVSTGRRNQPENTPNPITTMPSQSTSVLDMQQTGEPPPAPRVMPVYLPSKAKSQRSHREGRLSAAQGAQSGSDTERATGKHRMERATSGPVMQRSDGHVSSSTRDRGNHEVPMGSRDDVKRLENKYGVHRDTRQPLAPMNVDIPLVTPGIDTSALPTETRASIAPQIVSIRAGQGPSDPHDTHLKSSTILHSDAPQEIAIHSPQPTSASIVKSSSHARSQSSEVRAQPDRTIVVERSRTETRGDDLPPGQRMSIHESSRVLPIPSSKPYIRGNLETGVDNPGTPYPHSRPPSRSALRASANNAVPPAVVGPRPLRSVSQGPQMNEPPTRPPSVAQYIAISSVPSQHSVPPSPTHLTNGSPPRVGHTHGSLSSAQPSPKIAQLHGAPPSHPTSMQQAPSAPPSVHPTPIIAPQTLTASSRPSTRDGIDTPYTHQQLSDQQPTTDTRPGLGHSSNSTTVKASWVVQTPVTVKRAKISREDKYLGDHHFDSETSHAQLREVLSQDDPFPRASSSMMKASQATTPATSSQRNSPGTKTRDVPFGTPRGTLASSSPRSRSTKEAPTPEHVPRQNLPSHLAGPPQIAIVGATPIAMVRDLPQGHVDHALLAPPFPAPIRPSRTISSSQDQLAQQLPQPAAQDISSVSYQPPLAPVVHAPSLFQPYRPPSLPVPEGNSESSPPALPIPPPRFPEDSPPPIERRTSEIIPTRSQSDGHPQGHVYPVPEMQSEMFHIPSQPLPLPQLSSVLPLHATHPSPPSKPDSNTVFTSTSNEFIGATHADVRFLKPAVAQQEDVQVLHQETVGSLPVFPSQSSAPATRPRPKVTIEDVSEDSPVLSKAVPTNVPTITPSVPVSRPVQPSQSATVANVNSTLKSAGGDQLSHKASPQSRNRDLSLHRGTEPNATPVAPPMPPPTFATAPTSSRILSSAPPAQPTFFPSTQGAPAQRPTSHTASSRTHQRAAEMLQASKLSTSAGTNPGASGSVNKSTALPVQITYNYASTTTGQHQLVNGASVQSPSASRVANASSTAAPHPSVSATASVAKTPSHTAAVSSGPVVGALGLHISAPSTSTNTQPLSAPDPPRQQPSRPGALLMPLDATSTAVMSATAVKNAHQEQAIIDSIRPRDVTPFATRNLPPPSHIYPASAVRPSASSAMTQQTHVIPTQLSTHHRVVSLPITPSSSAVQKPPSPRKYSQPISSATVSTQPFPSRPSLSESQSARAPAPGHMFTPAPVRSARLPPPDRTNDFDMLKTPSSIAPSPMLSPETPNVLQSIAVPIRTRHSSTDSKDDKKRPSGLFGLFRTRTLSSKAADPPVVSTVNKASLDQGKVQPDASTAASTAIPVPHEAPLTSTPKGSNSAPPPVASTSTRSGPQTKIKGRILDPMAIPPLPMQSTREYKDITPHIFTPFKFLTMHSKRNRTVSAASLDVCDGNTATNTVIGSPDHSAISQAQPLPPIIPPDVRDPLVAASEWRDREEADRRERRAHRIRRPGVTFDVEEEPPSPAPGTAKRKRLVRRPSGRAATPGPARS